MLLYKNTKLRRGRRLVETARYKGVVKALVVSEPIATWQNLVEFGRLPRKQQVAANCLGNGNVVGDTL